MIYSEGIANAIQCSLDEKEFSYHFDKETGVFRMPFFVHGCLLKNIDIKIITRKVDFVLVATLPIGPNSENTSLMSEFLTRANWGMSTGAFEMDWDDGQINFKVSSMSDGDSAKAYIERAFAVLLHSIHVYGDGIVNISVGSSNDPKAECERLESISEEKGREFSRTMKRKLLEMLLEIHDDSDTESETGSDDVDVDNEDDEEQENNPIDSDTRVSLNPEIEFLFKLLSDNDEDNDE